MKKNNKKKFIFLALLLLVGAAIVVSYLNSSNGQEVEVFIVEKGEMKQYIEDIGTVKCKDLKKVYVENAGKIAKVNFNIGDKVKKGDILLSMEKEELELKLKDANAKIESARAQLKGTEYTNYENEIEIAKTAVDKAKVDYESAVRNYEQAKMLFDSGSVSEEELNKSQDACKAALIALNSANLQLEKIKKGTPDYVKEGYSSLLEQQIISRDNILMSIEKLQVRAPIDGVVIERNVEENSPVTSGTEAFVIGNVENLEIEADILVDDGYNIQVGNEVEISGKVVGDATITGKVVRIAPVAKTVVSSLGINQKRIPVYIDISESAKKVSLKPGYSVNVKIFTSVKKDIIKVPDTSVFDYNGKSSVFVVEDGKAKLKEITKGLEANRFIEVVDGIKEGDIILAKSDNDIREGMKVIAKNN